MKPIQERKMVLLIGPPGSGKTTLAHEAYPGYTLFDNDRIIEAVWGSLQYHPSVKHTAKRMRDVGIERTMRHGLALCITISGRTRRERAPLIALARANGYHITIVKASPLPADCLAHCQADPSRPKSTSWQPIIDRWFRVFEPVGADECDEYQEGR